MVISDHNSFRVLFDKIASVYFIWRMYLYFSIGSGQPRQPALCQLYRRTFVPYWRSRCVDQRLPVFIALTRVRLMFLRWSIEPLFEQTSRHGDELDWRLPATRDIEVFRAVNRGATAAIKLGGQDGAACGEEDRPISVCWLAVWEFQVLGSAQSSKRNISSVHVNANCLLVWNVRNLKK